MLAVGLSDLFPVYSNTSLSVLQCVRLSGNIHIQTVVW